MSMKMTYDSLSKSKTGPLNLTLNTALVYEYEYNGGMRFFLVGEYKLNINKLCRLL